MDSEFGFPSLGGAHLFDSTPDSFERLRYIKTPAQANAKWNSGTSAGAGTWLDNLTGTNKPIVASAIAARSKMQANFSTATAPGGKWERHLNAVGDAGVKQGARDKSGNYAQGTSQASAKQLAAITKIIAYEQAGLSQLTPSTQAGSGRARMNEWFDYMSAGAGTLSARS